MAEIDALDGVMGLASDQAGIHFRVLNASKGPAVRATRAQADRTLYKNAVREILEHQPNLQMFQQSVVDLVVENDNVVGCETQMGLIFRSKTVVLTTGTFLGGKIHIGDQQQSGGRAGDPPSIALAERLRALPFRVGRLKTGTPPRIDGRSVDFSELESQLGDDPRPVMSSMGKRSYHPKQISCHITYTNANTHQIITDNLSRSAMLPINLVTKYLLSQKALILQSSIPTAFPPVCPLMCSYSLCVPCKASAMRIFLGPDMQLNMTTLIQEI